MTVWCGSTEIYLTEDNVHSTPEKFVEAMKANHRSISPSMLYAWASISSAENRVVVTGVRSIY